MPATLRHFAINADNVDRARKFYNDAFGFSFTPWGPPNFYQIKNAGTGLLGALQERRELVQGKRAHTFETTLGVDDLKATMTAVEASGGRIVMPPFRIDGVGELMYFEDTEGNICGAMQYEAGVWE
ncbi:MAG: VOC family protein [Proteobacteria bacterium]|nr:VOC family protein [Pseudomonadota bacterium]